jgi:hypothetical protein
MISREPVLPELNRELLTKVVDHAISAENWNQGAWYMESDETACGTAMCVAGFTAIDFEGWKPSPGDSRVTRRAENGETERRAIPDVAREALGLTALEANALFAGSNTEVSLRRITQHILDGCYR